MTGLRPNQEPDGRGRGARLVVAAVVGCLLIAMIAAGCGSSSSSSSTSGESATSEPTGGTETGGSEGGAKKEVNLAMVETFSAIPFYVSAKNGAEAAAAADGAANLTVQAPAVTNGTNEATMAANLLAEEPEGFAPNPCVLPAWTRVLKEMTEQIPNENVVAWNCTPISEPGQTSPVRTFVGVSDVESGRLLAETVIKAGGLNSSTTGTVLLSACEEGVPILDHRREGAEEVFAKELPQAEVVTFPTVPSDQSKTTAAWTSEFSNHSDVVAAMGPCDGDSAALLTLKSKNGGSYAVGSFDPDEAELLSMQKGIFTAAVSTQPWTVGYVATALMAEGARGKPAPEGWVDTGILPITKSNAAEFAKASSSASAQSAFFSEYAEKAIKEAAAGTNVSPLDAAFE